MTGLSSGPAVQFINVIGTGLSSEFPDVLVVQEVCDVLPNDCVALGCQVFHLVRLEWSDCNDFNDDDVISVYYCFVEWVGGLRLSDGYERGNRL